MNRATDAGDTADAVDGEVETADVDRTPADRVMEQLGGVAGIIYSSVPVLVFVGTSRLMGLAAAAGAALGVATLILLWRLLRRESVQPAVSGLVGVAVCVLIAYLLGESKGYFLLGIWTSLIWAAVFAVSMLIRRPVVGYLWSWLHGHDRQWRDVRRAVYAFDVATLHLGAGVRRPFRGAAGALRHQPHGLAGGGTHRDGLAAGRRGGVGDLPGDQGGTARHRGRVRH